MAEPDWTDLWAVDPDRADPDEYPPGEPYVQQFVWAACGRCRVRSHAPRRRVLLAGLACPRCGATLLAPPPDASAALLALMREEDACAAEIER